MYSSQLETFVHVAEAGSFSRAAENAFITPQAVIKQITLLESSLGLKLFERTHRGAVMTAAGEALYKDAKYIIQYSKDSLARARNAARDSGNTVRVGTSLMTPGKLLMDLWPQVHEQYPELKIQLIPFENTPENAREILANLGRNIDVVVGIYDGEFLRSRGCAALELSMEPVSCAVSVQHRLAEKTELDITDLYGENLMLIRRGWNSYIDLMRDDLWQNHRRINIVDFSFYDVHVFNQCENNNDVLMVVSMMHNAHPLLKILPVRWPYRVPFGLLHATDPSPQMRSYLTAVSKAVSAHNL
ncbi:hypothetical protein FACS1894216_07530 [Synergistales bacterium]|nr:hypothetical protein FACS1894216_07530 [Synergistales bacterium]